MTQPAKVKAALRLVKKPWFGFIFGLQGPLAEPSLPGHSFDVEASISRPQVAAPGPFASETL